VEIISRADWGARYPAGFGTAPLPAREVWLHHTATSTPPADATEDQDAGDVRQVERIGQDRFGGGISYTFVVAPSGRVFEGTGVTRKGAHTKGRNSIARAIVLLGNFEVTRPTPQQLDAVAWLVAYGARAGWWPGQLAGGHRDAPDASTACPGKFAYAAIGGINLAARSMAGGTGPTARPTEDDEMTGEERAMLVEVRDMLRALKPGIRLPGRSQYSRNDSDRVPDDMYGHVLNGEANSADNLAATQALRQEVAALTTKLAAAGGMDPVAFANQVSTALARKLAG
jgi:N-acetylmuramoyl-L-alanine amidase